MKITRTSPLSGPHTLDLNVTQAQMDELQSPTRRMIQDIFPNLNDAEREFLLTGYTQEDWDAMFPKEDEGEMEAAELQHREREASANG